MSHWILSTSTAVSFEERPCLSRILISFHKQLILLVLIVCLEQCPDLSVKNRDCMTACCGYHSAIMESHSNVSAQYWDAPQFDYTPPRQIVPSLNTPSVLASAATSVSSRCVMLMPRRKCLLVWFPCCFLCPTVFICVIMFSFMSPSYLMGCTKPLCLSTPVLHRFSYPQKLFKLVGCASGLGVKSCSALFRYLWPFQVILHGMGTMQYYLKGSALAHATSPNLWAPRVSTLMSLSAVGLDMVNTGGITAPERIW